MAALPKNTFWAVLLLTSNIALLLTSLPIATCPPKRVVPPTLNVLLRTVEFATLNVSLNWTAPVTLNVLLNWTLFNTDSSLSIVVIPSIFTVLINLALSVTLNFPLILVFPEIIAFACKIVFPEISNVLFNVTESDTFKVFPNVTELTTLKVSFKWVCWETDNCISKLVLPLTVKEFSKLLAPVTDNSPSTKRLFSKFVVPFTLKPPLIPVFEATLKVL